MTDRAVLPASATTIPADPPLAEPAPTAVRQPSTGTRETLEDYTLRFAPRSYRRWGTGVVAVSALGGIAYPADFAIVRTLVSPAVRAMPCSASAYSPSSYSPLAYYAAP